MSTPTSPPNRTTPPTRLTPLPSIDQQHQFLPVRSSPLAVGSGDRPRRQSDSLLPPTSLSPKASYIHHAATHPVPSRTASSSGGRGKVLGRVRQLRAEEEGVVKRRAGGVLGRGFILKTDHYPTGRALDLDLNVQGAPNFRTPQPDGLNVYGVAQPTIPGLKSILTILQCQPRPRVETPTSDVAEGTAMMRRRSSVAVPDIQGHTIWFSTREETLVYIAGRPYVLRDGAAPLHTLALSDRASNLEDIERRLKLDILEEAKRYGGLILCHDEVQSGEIVPTWVSVDENAIRTPMEVYEDFQKAGWRVDYWRIPVAPDRPIEDNYLDAYVSRLKDTDPLTTSLVFNCGMGVVRTTFAMVAALLVRREQYLERGLDDPFPVATGSGFATPGSGAISTPPNVPQAAQFLQQASLQQEMNRSLLKVTRMLDTCLPSRRSNAAIDLLSTHPNLLESLRRAHMGNYQIVLSLLSSLDHGRETKRLVDQLIDDCDAVVNLRDNVIEYRLKYATVAGDDKSGQTYLDKAVRSLEQYFDLIVFAAFVEDNRGMSSGTTFSSWLRGRPEIWNQIKVLRRRGGDRLFAFAPANDLSVVSRSLDMGHGHQDARQGRTDLEGGRVLGDEWAEHVVKNRSGIMLRASTLLKRDLWVAESAASTDGIRGAIGFRQVAGANIYATGQPTAAAIGEILGIVKQRSGSVNSVVWICLREEPLVMINGAPYCLRRDTTALRNMRDYTGVSPARLGVLEERLRSDVVAESEAFGGSVLLHTETPNGEVVPLWEKVNPDDVESLREVMDAEADQSTDVKLHFERIPITSESSPDFHDISLLLDVCMRINIDKTAIILNDQLGRGRSSNTAVIVFLIERWLKMHRSQSMPNTPSRSRSSTKFPSRRGTLAPESRTSWQIINSCLRVVRNGLEVKRVVDEAIDRARTTYNPRDAVEDFRDKAQEAKSPDEKQSAIEKGMHSLLRYYHLLVFQAYLDDTMPDDEEAYTFEQFVKHRPVFKTLQNELLHGGLASLTPLERAEPADGMALEDEVSQVVANRRGAILSAQTILKSDFFSGLQKQSLPERVDGAANYRQVPLLGASETEKNDNRFVYGTGMPSAPGLRNALVKMDAEPEGKRKVMWTSLREEPVLYVNSRPHVLRLVDKPLINVETTGVSASVVERMESQLKEDVIKEIREGDGKLLLHDETETKPGVYEVIPIWETVEEENVMTPKELYESVVGDKFNVDYERIAITDEQAPLPLALQQIVHRVITGLKEGHDFVFNCQMGRGRTTTGMIAASLIATIATGDMAVEGMYEDEDEADLDDIEDANQYLNGEYKTILQLVTVLSHGKQAKRITDRVANLMEGVQNLRKAVYDFKLKVAAAEPGSQKHTQLLHQGVNYLFRYGVLIVLANFLLEAKAQGTPLEDADFPGWLAQHREISNVLSRKTLD